MNIVVVTQARSGSTRLPKKVLLDVEGKTLLQIHIERIKKATKVDDIYIATTTKEEDNIIVELSEKYGVKHYRGSENDVLDRFYQTVKKIKPEYVVRLTSDCPLIDPKLLDEIILKAKARDLDYYANIIEERYPDGQDIEVFKYSALKKAWKETTLKSDREHVTPYIRNNSSYNGGTLFKSDNHGLEKNYSSVRLTVDEPQDLEVIKSLVRELGLEKDWKTYADYYLKSPKISSLNRQIMRNEGYLQSMKKEQNDNRTGQNLYKKAKALIPGGTMLLSKRPEMFLPENWPSYFSEAKGCKVRDLDGDFYIDMSIMGIGTNTLGYGYDEVDNAVLEAVKKGNMSTFNCPEEVSLAEKLVEINPWADMVRFARSGGEANSIAIRIARAASGKDKVAICGYHGWHDWYLSANHNSSDELSSHLLSGLNPKGVPKNLKNTVYPFHYNDFEELQSIVNDNDIGVIKMEVVRNFGPEDNFLQKVRDLADEKNIVLIFDECTSGFRETYGGIYKKYGVEPDVAMFGKTLGNGYALTAVVGKRSVMEAAQTTFISSTFWTERIGPTAALKTLEVMEKLKSWEIITHQGTKMQNQWKNMATKHNLYINVSGIPALSTYSFESDNAMAYKTFITQEMLKKGFLASTNFYACIAHTDEYISQYFDALDDVYHTISDCEKGNKSIYNLLEGPVCHSGFKRLN